LQIAIGSEGESDEVIAHNIRSVYDALIHALPNHAHNIKNVGVKLTMGKVVVL
jgi:ribosomal protein L1